MSGLVSALRLVRQRDKLGSSFRTFAEQTVMGDIPRRVAAPHHDVVCRYIQDLADDPEGGILVVLMPPGGGKSMLCARALPAWVLGREPRARVLLVGNAMPLVESHGRAIRAILQTRRFQNAFDNTVSPVSAGASAFLTTAGGEFFGVGSAGASLGRRAEWLIIDDPVGSFEEAHSLSQMTKLHEAWENNLATRLVPNAKVVLIQQRLSSNDLAGHILSSAVEGGRSVRVLRLPMLCDDPGGDPMGRAEGEPLWPEYWTKGMLVDAQSDPYRWQTLYQQRPPSDFNAWCDVSEIGAGDAPTATEVVGSSDWSVYLGIDIAHSVNRGDATVFAVVAFEKSSARMHLVDLYRDHVDHAFSVEKLLDLMARWKPTWMLIDNDIGSTAFVSHLKTRAGGRGLSLGRLEIVPMRGRTKEERAGALRAKIKSGLLVVDRGKPWAGVVLRELAGFPNLMGNAVDDVVDALALVAGKASLMTKSAGSNAVAKAANPKGSFFDATLDDLWAAHKPSERGRARI